MAGLAPAAARRFTVAVTLASAAFVLVIAVGWLLRIAPGDSELTEFSPVAALTFTLFGGLMVPRRPHNPVGWLFIAIGFSSALGMAGYTFSGHRLMAWMWEWLWLLPYGLLLFALLLFPDGRLPSSRWRLLVWLAAAGQTVAVVFLALALWEVPTLLAHTPPRTTRAYDMLQIARAGMWLVLAGVVAAAGSLVLRWRQADGDTRRQLRVLAVGAGLALLGIGLELADLPGSGVICAVTIPAAMAVAILKHRLYDIDLFLNRSLVYAVLTLLIVGLYAGIVSGLGRLSGARLGRGPELMATGLIAAVFQPLRQRLQRGANRLLYGDRDDPYAVVSRLGRRLEQAADPAAVLTQVTETVSHALQLPYAAIEVADSKVVRLVASYGRRWAEPEVFAMVYQGQVVGRLLVTPRAPDQGLTAAERDLLRDLARQAGLATHAVGLNADLQRSRERLVRSREEERRRLRRDLHDGLGPALAGMTMQVGAAKAVLATDAEQRDAQAAGVLGVLEQQLATCVGEIRRLVDDLRPPALDEFGLVAAIRQRISAFTVAGGASGPEIIVSAPDDLGELPAAVEVAVYRIAVEAVTNTVRHAAASRCLVRLSAGERLTVEVVDDGVGLPEDCRRGVGLASMRERADELGGALLVQRPAEGGTRIHAELPLWTPDPR